jgi:hypothetical protein
MSPATVIYNLLKDSVPVGALIGDRIYATTIPANIDFPAVVYHETIEEKEQSKDGPIQTGNHFCDVDIYSKNYSNAKSIAAAIDTELDWYTGTKNSVTVERIWKTEQQDMPYEVEKELFHITQTFGIRVA